MQAEMTCANLPHVTVGSLFSGRESEMAARVTIDANRLRDTATPEGEEIRGVRSQ